jgi:hypothetical protein
MKMQKELIEIKGRLNRVTHELIQIKKIFIELNIKDEQKAEQAWNDLMSASKEISKTWRGRNCYRRDKRSKRKEMVTYYYIRQFCYCCCFERAGRKS